MEIHGVDLQEMRALVAVIDAIDTEWYQYLVPTLPQSDQADHWSDIRVVSLDENEIHLANRVGWRIDADIGEEWASEIILYEAKVPLKQLLDETIPITDRIQLVKWVKTEVQQVAKTNELHYGNEGEIRNKGTITTTWNRMDKPPVSRNLDEVVRAVDIINAAIREVSPNMAAPSETRPTCQTIQPIMNSPLSNG